MAQGNPNGGPGRNPLGVPVKPPRDLKMGTKPLHEAIIDAIIAQPQVRAAALAAQFGYSVEGIRVLMRTDAFREKLAERKGEIVDPLLTASVEERLKSLADLSIQRLLEKLSANPSDRLVTDSVELSTRALGYGARQQPTAVNNYIAVVPAVSPSPKAWEAQYGAQATSSPEIEDAQPAQLGLPLE